MTPATNRWLAGPAATLVARLAVCAALAAAAGSCAHGARVDRVIVENWLGEPVRDDERDDLVRLARQHLGAPVEKLAFVLVGHPEAVSAVRVYTTHRERPHAVVERSVIAAYHPRWTGRPASCAARSPGGWCLGAAPEDRWTERFYRVPVQGGRTLVIRVEDGHLPGAVEVRDVESLLAAVIARTSVSKRKIPSPLGGALPLFSVARWPGRVCAVPGGGPHEPPGLVLMYGDPMQGVGYVFVKRGGRWHHERACEWTA